ncbi:MAG: Cof-type HAD-IIB family hydrolase [Synergistaceae bacterium]|nr:Cof-type HAD-IIB family hydrolase [Synergistaceae bacterium]
MSIFKPKLVAVDIDGTILNSSSELSSRTKNALRSAILYGVPVVAATGRMYPSALPVIKEIGISAPCVFYNGAVVRDPISEEIIYKKSLGKELTAEVISYYRQESWYIQVYSDDKLYVEDSRDPRSMYYENISRIKPVSLGEGFWDFKADSTKLLGIALDDEDFVIMAENTKSRFGGRIYTATSWGAFVEITHPEVNKAKGLMLVAERLGVDPKDVLAIGDGVNDKEMIIWAGHGVAMGNAPDNVKAAADETAPDNDSDGAAVILERYLGQGDT